MYYDDNHKKKRKRGDEKISQYNNFYAQYFYELVSSKICTY